MAPGCDEANERLGRWAERETRRRAREMGAVAVADEEPMLFVAGEVLVGRKDRDLIEECLAKGGEVIPPLPLAEAPVEVSAPVTSTRPTFRCRFASALPSRCARRSRNVCSGTARALAQGGPGNAYPGERPAIGLARELPGAAVGGRAQDHPQGRRRARNPAGARARRKVAVDIASPLCSERASICDATARVVLRRLSSGYETVGSGARSAGPGGLADRRVGTESSTRATAGEPRNVWHNAG